MKKVIFTIATVLAFTACSTNTSGTSCSDSTCKDSTCVDSTMCKDSLTGDEISKREAAMTHKRIDSLSKAGKLK